MRVEEFAGPDTATDRWDPSSAPRESRAWSDRAQRWVRMDFVGYQAWLARPDLDPVDFEINEHATV